MSVPGTASLRVNAYKAVFIPIPFPGNYNTLCATACKGVHVPYNGCCPKCGAPGSFFFTKHAVSRGAVLSEAGTTYRRLPFPLARCIQCGRWARVLPLALLPRKTFGIQVIQVCSGRYLFTAASLRKAAAGSVSPPQHSPSHSTLHR